jgi:hypothetical protein
VRDPEHGQCPHGRDGRTRPPCWRASPCSGRSAQPGRRHTTPSPEKGSIPAQTTQLLLLDDLEDARRTGDLPTADREALQAVAEWVKGFVARPHQDLGRSGTVCPFVPGSLERKTLWLTAEHLADAGPAELADLMEDYRRLLLATPPVDGDDAMFSTIMVVFPDLPAERAGALFDDVLGRIASSAYEEDGSCSGRSTRATRGPRSTTPRSTPSGRPCRSCSSGTRS